MPRDKRRILLRDRLPGADVHDLRLADLAMVGLLFLVVKHLPRMGILA
jgi:hypothetical protein